MNQELTGTNNELLTQRNYWNRSVDDFHSIYSHQKSKFAIFLDEVFRKDMYERYVFTMENSAPIAGRRFLDVGCGSGVYSLEFVRRGAAQVTGLDIAASSRVIASTALSIPRLSAMGLAPAVTFFAPSR